MTNNIYTEFGDDPLAIFQKWYKEAENAEPADANAMALATADKDGRPSVRQVLLRRYDERGFAFFTNYESRKGRDLAENPCAELNFYWKSTERQIRIAGPAVKTSEAESDEYFKTRPRESQIGAWASRQTTKLDDFTTLQAAVKEMEEKFKGKDVPRPPHWGGYRIIPERMEFWSAQPHRLHKRFVFEKYNDKWETTWLFP